MTSRVHQRRHHRDIPIRRAGKQRKERDWWGFVGLLNAACDAWLVKRRPGYRAEKENRQFRFGKNAQ